MRTYVLTLVIPEGGDEFWEETAKLGHKKAGEAVAELVADTLAHVGLYTDYIKITPAGVIETNLGLGMAVLGTDRKVPVKGKRSAK